MKGRFLDMILVLLIMVVMGMSTAVARASESSGELGVGPGASSGGSIGVTLRIPEMVRLSGLRDLDLQWESAGNRFHAENGLCVYRNAGGDYSVVASSTTGGGNGFVLNADDSEIAYNVEWNAQRLEDSQRVGPFSDGHPTSLDCNGGENVNLQVHASAEQVGAADRLATHSDTLVLQVVAE